MKYKGYAALIEAGASDEKASAASTAIANYEKRFHKIETLLKVQTVMLGVNTAGIVLGLKLLTDILQKMPIAG